MTARHTHDQQRHESSGSSSPARSRCWTSSRWSATTCARGVGLDEDSLHWVGVAIRESVINAIKHGNRSDDRQAWCSSSSRPRRGDVPRTGRSACATRAKASIPKQVADPLAPENLLKSSGRGIFLIRNFMDDVALQRAPEGGMEVRMVKRAAVRQKPDLHSRDALTEPRSQTPHCPSPAMSIPGIAPIPSLFLTTAIEAVVRAGDMQMARFGGDFADRQEGHDRSGHRGRPRRRARCSAR